MPGKTHRLLTGAVAGLALSAIAVAPATAASAASATAGTRSVAAEARLVDAVPTPKLGWYKCYEIAECATVKLPLDYSQPRGAKTEIAVLRVKAKNAAKRVGSLFLNPGGPGGSSTDFALYAPNFLSDSLLERFDIVGVDPRGIGASANLKCFPSVRAQTAVLDKLNVPFPVTEAEEKTYVTGSSELGKACSTTGKPLAGAVSTAEVARDMDVIRRAVGDQKLTYLGFSYGSVLGQYYANMFPDRFRALAVDGTLDPRAWVGNTRQIIDARLRSSDGAYGALIEILKRCDQAGETRCVFAAGDPVRNFADITAQLRKKPLTVVDGEDSFVVTYADFISVILQALYEPNAGELVTGLAAELSAALSGSTAALGARAAAAKAGKPGYDFPYYNGFEAATAVICTDGHYPANAGSWPAAVADRDQQAPYFGRLWGWLDSPCATETWTVRDEEAYAGPFTRSTTAPLLVVGNYWDPATSYANAVAASGLQPNARLLTSNNWGHTAYGSGVCATSAIDAYLLTGVPSEQGTVCTDSLQPFTEPLAGGGRIMSATGKQRPPVATLLPDSVLSPAK